MRRLVVVFAALALAFAFAGSTAAAPKPKGVTIASMYDDSAGMAGLQAMMEYCGHRTGTDHTITDYLRPEFQDGIVDYLAGKPETMFTWFGGERMRFLADQRLLTPINDVWRKVGGNYTDAFKIASTGNDGKQYLIPMIDYPWVVVYRTSVFADHGYTVPTTFAEFMSLAARMKSDGLPMAFGNAEGWPAMGTFDILDMRMNGYQFHMDLMAGRAQWTDPRVVDVFEQWRELLTLVQDDGNDRSWLDADFDFLGGNAGMYFIGTFAGNWAPDQAVFDDLAMFPFPLFGNEWDSEKAIDAPIDGLALSTNRHDMGGAKKLLGCVATGKAQLKFLESNPGYVAAAKDANTSGYTPYQKQMAQIIGSSNRIGQFLDRDTRLDFAGPDGMQGFLKDFIADPSQDLTPFLAGIQAFYDALP